MSDEQEKVMQGLQQIFETANKNRTEGLERADKALLQLDEVKGVTNEPNAESRLRALEVAVRGLTPAVEAINALLNLVMQDIVSLAKDLQTGVNWTHAVAGRVVMLQKLLVMKGILTKEEMDKAWEEANDESQPQ
jgi:hypothetical protein